MKWSSFPSFAIISQFYRQSTKPEYSSSANIPTNIQQQDVFIDGSLSFGDSFQPFMGPGKKLNQDNCSRQQQPSYLVDSQGNVYDSYSLAWRYLGMYIDCEIGDKQDQSSVNDSETNFFLEKMVSKEDKVCSRKLLWAAYVDPGYMDGSIGEYQYFDWRQETWDTSTCQTPRCAKMDCHAENTHFQLVGVFKETDGLVDWAEQLIKHEGYCVWDDLEHGGKSPNINNNDHNDNSDYEFMFNRQNDWSSQCKQMYYTDSNDNALFRDIKPMEDGNITDALYYDEHCSQPASMGFHEYIIMFYANYYYNEDAGKKVAEKWLSGTNRWNELMTDFKICQPCRAHRKVPNFLKGENKQHYLGTIEEGANKDTGDDEQWGYNCQDDDGCHNSNQCHMFESKTDLEPATSIDLKRASAQGTILSIKVDGVTYGKGGFGWGNDDKGILLKWILTVISFFGALASTVRLDGDLLRKCWDKLKSRRFPKKLHEAFLDEHDEKAQQMEEELRDEQNKEEPFLDEPDEKAQQIEKEIREEQKKEEVFLDEPDEKAPKMEEDPREKQEKVEEHHPQLDSMQPEIEQLHVIQKMAWLRDKAVQNSKWLGKKSIQAIEWCCNNAIRMMEWLRNKAIQKMEWLRNNAFPNFERLNYKSIRNMDGVRNQVIQHMKWLGSKSLQSMEWLRNKSIQYGEWFGNKVIQTEDWLRNKAFQHVEWLHNKAFQNIKWLRDNASCRFRTKSGEAFQEQQTEMDSLRLERKGQSDFQTIELWRKLSPITPSPSQSASSPSAIHGGATLPFMDDATTFPASTQGTQRSAGLLAKVDTFLLEQDDASHKCFPRYEKITIARCPHHHVHRYRHVALEQKAPPIHYLPEDSHSL